MAHAVTDEKRAMVAGAVNLGVRAALVEAKVAAEVRAWVAERDAGALPRLDATTPDGWVPVEDHVLMLEGAAAVLGLERLAELARTRTRTSALGSLFPQIVTSWTRSFAGDPVAVARIVEPLMRASLRNVGTFELRVGSGEFTTRWSHNPWLAKSAAWRAHIAGTTEGIHDLAGTAILGANVVVVDAETVDVVVRWQPAVIAHAG